MNLVALLIAAQVVRYDDDPVVRAVAAGAATLGIVIAVAISKRRTVPQEMAAAPPVAAEPAPVPSGGPSNPHGGVGLSPPTPPSEARGDDVPPT
jgi:hypothetical protein